jgi:signal transduction histidine kinase
LSIRARLLLLILFATLIPALVGGTFFRNYRETQVDDAKRELANTTKQVAQALAETIRSTSQLHYGLSRARDFDTNDRGACSNFLAEVLSEHPQYTGILTIKPNGQLFCDSLRTGRNLDLTDRRYFQDAMKSGNPLAVEPAFGRLTGTAVLQIAYGVRNDKGAPKFVLLASLNLEKYMQTRSQGLPSKNTTIALIDSKGTILTWHPDGDKKRGTSIANTALFDFAVESADTNTRDDIQLEGMPRIWVSTTLPGFEKTGLHVLVGASRDDLLAAANNKLLQARLTVAAVWLLVFFCAWALAELAIRRPTARIVAAVKQFSEGDFGARIGTPYPRGEIGELMVELDQAFAVMQSQREVIQQLNADLEVRVIQRTAQLESANKELEAFGYTVSHDLRAPVRHVSGFAKLAVERAATLDEETRRYLHKIMQAATHMGKLIDDMLELSRAGRAELRFRRIDLNTLINTACEECQRDAEGRTITWNIGTLPAVRGDAGLLRQVFVNLIGNAVKYSAGVENTVITIAAEDIDDRDVRISVRDNGAGFDMTYAGKLFGVFQRLHNDERFAGTGIGLATVKRIIERHDGRVWGEGKVNEGAVFYVVLKKA